MTTMVQTPLTLSPDPALIEALYRAEGKAEIVHGRIQYQMATGRAPGFAGDEIAFSLRSFVRANRLSGIAVADGKGFLVSLPNRSSFSPDAAYYEGPNSGMKFYTGAPLFAAEVRSENDYGPAAEFEMEEKRRDYFAAGTRVVWDVDVQSENVVRKFVTPDANTPSLIFRKGENADAQEAVPGWTIPVDELFEPTEQ